MKLNQERRRAFAKKRDLTKIYGLICAAIAVLAGVASVRYFELIGLTVVVAMVEIILFMSWIGYNVVLELSEDEEVTDGTSRS